LRLLRPLAVTWSELSLIIIVANKINAFHIEELVVYFYLTWEALELARFAEECHVTQPDI